MIPRTIRVFIASPRDAQKQRKIADTVIRDLNTKFERVLGVTLQTVRWEAFRPAATESADEDVQQPITRRVDKCHLFIGILNRRYGTPSPRTGISGTHDEFRFALSNRDRISILTYCDTTEADKSSIDIEESERLARLKEEIQQAGVLTKAFRVGEFERLLMLDLMEALLELTTELRRREKLERFFRLGVRRDQRDPSVLIGYPPIHKHTRPTQQANYNWTQRLVPNVVYDDFRAIQKLESAFRSMGVSELGSVTVPHPRLVDPPGNRVWLCLPRNEMAQEELTRLQSRVWFKFSHDMETDQRVLDFVRPGRNTVVVRSPLAAYLKASRPNRPTAWDSKFGYTVGVDYAILARFKYAAPAGGTPLYHYYIAGIRGLGTWGAGWFVDHHYEELAAIADRSEGDDIQILLEVRFRDYRIASVRVVSDEQQEYFDHVNKTETIQRDLASHVGPFRQMP